MRGIIALLTDFGLKDPYVGMMKAVITSINPQAVIIDLTHDIPKFNVSYGAFILKASYKYFRKGTIFIAVVDPEVGTSRKGIIIVTNNYVFIGPNNGILTPAALSDGILELYEIDINRVRIGDVSSTFHGRDVFAPTAALLSLGVKPSSIGRMLNKDELTIIDVPPYKPVRRGDCLEATAYYVDDFGNIILDVELNHILAELGVKLNDEVLIKVGERVFHVRVVNTFADVCEGCLALYRDSFGLAEVGVFKGSAYNKLGINVGDKICIGKG